jgi:hypothetical protein
MPHSRKGGVVMLMSNRAIRTGSSLFTMAKGHVQKSIQQTKTWLNKPAAGTGAGMDDDDAFYAHLQRMRSDKKYRGQVRGNFRDFDQ